MGTLPEQVGRALGGREATTFHVHVSRKVETMQVSQVGLGLRAHKGEVPEVAGSVVRTQIDVPCQPKALRPSCTQHGIRKMHELLVITLVHVCA